MDKMSELTMTDVRHNNKASGRFWFSPETMRFFKSRVESRLLKQRYFITSEQFGDDFPRLFTIRVYDPKTHQIDTVGKFQDYKTKQEAIDEVSNLP